MREFGHLFDGHDNDPDRPDFVPPSGDGPVRKIRLAPVRMYLGQLHTRLYFGRVRRFAPEWLIRFFPSWPRRLARMWAFSVAAGVMLLLGVAAVSVAGRRREATQDAFPSAGTSARPRAREEEMRFAGRIFDLASVPLSLAGALLVAAIDWRERRERLTVAVITVPAASAAVFFIGYVLTSPLEWMWRAPNVSPAQLSQGAGVSWEAMAAAATSITVISVLLREAHRIRSAVLPWILWPMLVGGLELVTLQHGAEAVAAGWAAGCGLAVVPALLYRLERRRGLRAA